MVQRRTKLVHVQLGLGNKFVLEGMMVEFVEFVVFVVLDKNFSSFLSSFFAFDIFMSFNPD
jgi:hypothetical protein